MLYTTIMQICCRVFTKQLGRRGPILRLGKHPELFFVPPASAPRRDAVVLSWFRMKYHIIILLAWVLLACLVSSATAAKRTTRLTEAMLDFKRRSNPTADKLVVWVYFVQKPEDSSHEMSQQLPQISDKAILRRQKVMRYILLRHWLTRAIFQTGCSSSTEIRTAPQRRLQ
jgi:hypothetical protein